MEITDRTPTRMQVCPDKLPSLLKHTAAEAVVGFDSVSNKNQSSLTSDPCASPLRNQAVGSQITSSVKESESADVGEQVHVHVSHHTHSISISMPSCPTGVKTAEFDGAVSEKEIVNTWYDQCANSSERPKQLFYSQPIPASIVQRNGSVSQNDKCFDPFKTWSGRLERQISNLRGRPQEPPSDPTDFPTNEIQVLPVDRYFDALEGPELDTLKASEVPVLPKDTHWPFLLRFPISSYGICLGLGSQAILWKTLATSPSISFLRVNLKFNLILWCISLALLVLVSSIYLLKIVFYFEAVKREYHHPVRVNFFFAPWIACLFLAIGVPPSIAGKLQAPLWYVMMAPILCLELKIYGQWMSGGQRRLSKVANPSNHLSIVGNFVGALLGASMGMREGPIFFFAIGLAHYTVLFVTLYQRLPTNETLPKELHPVFFLFVAAPSVACMAWARIRGDFDYGSRIAYFTALFLYVSLAVRINFFRGFRFSLAWWAYTFPMTGASIATIRYSMEMKNLFTQSLSVALTAISTFMVSALLVSTIVHAFVLRDLFPNDVSIAISEKRLKSRRKHGHRRSRSSDEKEHGDAGSPDSLRSQLSV